MLALASACTVHKAQGASVDAAVSVIDRSAPAELIFVAASRSKHELDIVVARSVFEDINDLARHVSERISLKTTTRTYDELLDRTGGKQTMRVLNMEAQRQAIPLRREYEADVVEPLRMLQMDRVEKARQTYQGRKGDIDASGLSMEEGIAARREALREMRTAVTTAYRELRPEPFGEWLGERQQRWEDVRLKNEQQREHEQAYERGDQPVEQDQGLAHER